MIKKFKIELFVLGLLALNIYVSYNIDIGFYNFFKNFNQSVQSIYLKNFFIQITALGDSKWYFAASFIFMLVGFIIREKKYFQKYKKNINKLLKQSLFLFLSLLITGIITQILKHIVGRPRPNYTTLDQSIGFDFFNFSSNFHSFPSGHTSTIFALAIVLSVFLPKSKIIMFIFAGIIAFSRVVVGAHFFTDIIGGVVIAFVGVKITKMLLNKFDLFRKNDEVIYFPKSDGHFISVFVVFIFLAIFLSIGPSIDMYISGLFYYGKGQFFLQSYYDVTIFFRKIVLRAIIIYILIIPILSMWLPLSKVYFGFIFNIKTIVFLWLASFFNMLIIINLLFKSFWGRARPGDILQLGGGESFTPWYEISNACNTNCSFVSGDAAIGFSIIALYFVTKIKVFFWLSLLFGLSLGLIRIMEGGHFFSDVIMAAIIIYIFFSFQTKFFLKKND